MKLGTYAILAERAARAGGEVLLAWEGRFRTREKAPRDLVTDADLASQEAIRALVAREFPDHAFLGEEAAVADLPEQAAWCWIVDPLDGTANYVHGLPYYCVSVALAHHGQVVCGCVFQPRTGECFVAEAGGGAYLDGDRLRVSRVNDLSQAMLAASFSPKVERTSPAVTQFVEALLAAQSLRRMGAAALNLAYLAAGRFDAYWAADTKVWDVAAGLLLVQEAGGVVTGLTGAPVSLAQPAFAAAATSELHAELMALIGGDV
ncbi:MAG: inositol monophosphatase family protein [Pirellulales bacterium]